MNKFWVLPYSGTIFNSPEECDERIRHDLIESVDVNELKDLIDEMIKEEEKYIKKLSDEGLTYFPRYDYKLGKVKALTELKEKL